MICLAMCNSHKLCLNMVSFEMTCAFVDGGFWPCLSWCVVLYFIMLTGDDDLSSGVVRRCSLRIDTYDMPPI